MTRRVLLLNQYLPPDRSATAPLAAGLAAALTGRGAEVVAVCGRPSYDVLERPAWRLLEDVPASASAPRLLRVGSAAGDRAGMRARLANYASFSALAVPTAISHPAARRADVVVSMTDPPIAPLLGHAVARALGRPHVTWVQDLHPEFSIATGLLPDGSVASAWRRARRPALAAAAAVVALGRDMADLLAAAGADPARTHVVHNGAEVDDDVQSGARVDAGLVASLRGDASLLVVHGGNIGHAGAWEALVEAARGFPPGVRLAFVGDGARKDDVRALAADVPSVTFVDRLPAASMPSLLAAGDLHVVTERPGVEGTVVPSKLYGILAAGRPVLAVCPPASEPAMLVAEHRCGLVADPSDPRSIAVAVAHAASHPEERAAWGASAAQAARCYERRSMLERIATIVEDVSQPGAGRRRPR